MATNITRKEVDEEEQHTWGEVIVVVGHGHLFRRKQSRQPKQHQFIMDFSTLHLSTFVFSLFSYSS